MPTTTQTDDPQPELLVDLRLPPDPTSPARARQALDPLEERFDEDTLFKLRLLVSELVTNSVRHARLRARDLIAVRVLCELRALRVEILDAGPGFAASAGMLTRRGWEYQHTHDPEWPGGWGLSIVESLADSWGITRDEGTTVWFEVELAGGRG
jgi:anti-sigma regulatory factor (Ser/Thr protein kinase)